MNKKIIFISFLFFLLLVYFLLPKGVNITDSLRIIKGRNFQNSTKLDKLQDLNLRISWSDLRILEGYRVEAINSGFLNYDLRKNVPVKIDFGNETFKAKTSLKGSLGDHWLDPVKWSFKIKTSDGKVFGMPKFSLHDKGRRGFVVDHFYHRLLNKMGVANLRMENVNFNLNGHFIGVYEIEERFASSILKRLKLPEGPIVKYDYEKYWSSFDWKKPMKRKFRREREKELFKKVNIKAYNIQYLDTLEYNRNRVRAFQLLDSFSRGSLITSEVFDVDKLGAFFVVNTLCFNQHPAYNTNIRFYYNRITGLLEPIGFDLERIHILEINRKNFECEGEDHIPSEKASYFMTKKYFEDSLMRKSYNSNLKRLANSDYVEKSLEEISFLSNEFKKMMKGKKKWKGIKDIVLGNLEILREDLNKKEN